MKFFKIFLLKLNNFKKLKWLYNKIFIVNETSNDFILKNTFQYFYFVTTYLTSESDGRYVHILELDSNTHNISILLLNPN